MANNLILIICRTGLLFRLFNDNGDDKSRALDNLFAQIQRNDWETFAESIQRTKYDKNHNHTMIANDNVSIWII